LLDLVLTVFRYIFLIMLYVFIFQLIKMMFRDLKTGEVVQIAAGKKAAELSPEEIKALPGSVAGLVVTASGDPGLPHGKVYSLKSEDQITFGRGGKNTIAMTDPFASLDHASVFGSEGQYRLEDRGSKNGTFLNDVRITKPTVLADGDRIRIGDVSMQFVRWAYEVESGNRSGIGKETKRG